MLNDQWSVEEMHEPRLPGATPTLLKLHPSFYLISSETTNSAQNCIPHFLQHFLKQLPSFSLSLSETLLSDEILQKVHLAFVLKTSELKPVYLVVAHLNPANMTRKDFLQSFERNWAVGWNATRRHFAPAVGSVAILLSSWQSLNGAVQLLSPQPPSNPSQNPSQQILNASPLKPL